MVTKSKPPVKKEPKTEPKEECKKKMVKKQRVLIDRQWVDFDSQKAAREHAREILQNNAVYFMSMYEVEVEEKDC